MTPNLYSATSVLQLLIFFVSSISYGQNRDPENIKIVTSDLDNFWAAYDKSLPDYDSKAFHDLYIKSGSKGLKGFMNGRIKNAENLVSIIKKRPEYYASLRTITPKVAESEEPIKKYLAKMKEVYPEAVFPPVYFVIGAMNSGGTSSRHGLIIGLDMYGLTADTPMDELSKWHKEVLKSVDEVPHIVVHELVHFQQKYDGNKLLSACIKEGAADFIAELVSGKHINGHVHEFANPRESELWEEFKSRMHDKDYSGWLYSSQKGRPNDLGYWMGYQITKSYYDKAADKKAAMSRIMNIKNFDRFLADSGYADKF